MGGQLTSYWINPVYSGDQNTYREYFYSIEHVRVDTAHLLKEHQTQRYQQRSDIHSVKDSSKRRWFLARICLIAFFDFVKFLCHIRIWSTKPL